MDTATLKLTDYQVRGVKFIRSNRLARIVFPTSGGKTATFKSAAALMLATGELDTVIALAPMTHIVDDILAPEDYLVDDIAIREVWQSPEGYPTKRGLYAATHQLARQWFVDGSVPEDMDRTMIILDEGHHAAVADWALALSGLDGLRTDPLEFEGPRRGTQIWRFLDAAKARGARIVVATATDWRSDSFELPEAAVYRVAYSTVVAAGLGVPKFTIRTLPCDLESETWMEDIAAMIATQDVQNGRPRPAVVMVPQVLRSPRTRLAGDVLVPERDEGVSMTRMLEAQIATLLESHGLSVLRTVGEPGKEPLREELARARHAHRNEGWTSEDYDVILSCRRFGEGSNWRIASHLVILGVSERAAAIIQAIGRILRSKFSIAGYPREWAEEVVITFLVPPRMDEDGIRHRHRLLLIAAALEGDDGLDDWSPIWKQLAERHRIPRAIRGPYQSLLDQALQGCSQEEKVAAVNYLLDLAGRLSLKGIKVTIGRLVSMVAADIASDSQTKVEALRTLLRGTEASREEIEERAERGLVRVMDEVDHRAPPPPDQIREIYLTELLAGLIEVAGTVQAEPFSLDRFPGGWTSTTTEEFLKGHALSVRRARRAAQEHVVTPEVVSAVLGKYVAEKGRPPVAVGAAGRSEDLYPYAGLPMSVGELDDALQAKWGIGVAQAVELLPWIHAEPYDVESLLAARRSAKVRAFAAADWDARNIARAMRDRRYMFHYNGGVEHAIGVYLAARCGWRGIPAGTVI